MPTEYVTTAKERRQVRLWSSLGFTQETMADWLGVSVETLVKHFADEIRAGESEKNPKVSRRLYEKAMSGDTAAMIWWEKTRQRRHEYRPPPEPPPAPVDLSTLSDEELRAQLRAAADAPAPKRGDQ